MTDPGFDASILSEFRARLIAHGLEEQVLETLLVRLGEWGLVKAGDKGSQINYFFGFGRVVSSPGVAVVPVGRWRGAC